MKTHLFLPAKGSPLNLAAGFVLPECRLMPGEGDFKDFPLDLPMEEYYKLIMKDREKYLGPPGESGGDKSDPGGCGGVVPSEDQAAGESATEVWRGKVASAHQEARARGVGTMSGPSPSGSSGSSSRESTRGRSSETT